MLFDQNEGVKAQQFFSPDELSQRWGINKKLVYSEIANGRLRALKIGNKILRVAVSELERYEEKFMGGGQ